MKPRTFDREFKLQLVRQLLSGERRPSQLCREHSICASFLRTWRLQYDQKGEEAWMEAPVERIVSREQSQTLHHGQAKEARIAALEAALGRAHLENEFLRQAIAKKASQPGRKLL